MVVFGFISVSLDTHFQEIQQVKKQLQFPVHKEVIRTRYGQKCADGGIAKGFVIQSRPGEQVVNVGAGQVAYVGQLLGMIMW